LLALWEVKNGVLDEPKFNVTIKLASA